MEQNDRGMLHQADPHYIGMDRFIHFYGVVEDRDDPLRIGRCRLRIFGVHPEDKAQMATEDLPWAVPILPVLASPASGGSGHSPVGPIPGTFVVGFFADGMDRQQPFFFGTIPGGAGAFGYAAGGGVTDQPDSFTKDVGPIKEVPTSASIIQTGAIVASNVLNHFKSKYPNLKPAHVCAIAGNMALESAGFQAVREFGKGSGPKNVPPPKGTVRVGYGWAQWTNGKPGGRLDQFLNFCEKNNYKYDSSTANMAYMIYEMENEQKLGIGSFCKQMFSAFNQGGQHSFNGHGPYDVDNVDDATRYVMYIYERPAAKAAKESIDRRISYARSILNGLNKSSMPPQAAAKPTK